MSRPFANNLNTILDKCLLRLQAGETIESVLVTYPALSEDLRPVLEAVIAIWSARGSDTVPVAAMMRSRARMLSATSRLSTIPRPPWWRVQWALFTGMFSRPRAVMVPLIGLIVIASLLFSGLASAQALPGELFYPVKIAAEKIGLSFAGSPSDRLEREEIYDLRRKEEVEALITQNREEEVYITGFLIRVNGGEWWIDEIKISIPSEVVPEAERMENRYVYLHADLLSHGELMVEWIEPRVYLITGRITNLEALRLMVGDVWMKLDQDSDEPQLLEVGQMVRASITRLQGEDLVALKIEVIGQAPTPSNTARPVFQPSETPQPNDEDNPPTQPEVSPETEKNDKSDENKDGHNQSEETQKAPNESENDQHKADKTPDEDQHTRTLSPTRTPAKKL